MKSLSIALEKVDFLPPTRVTDDTSVLTLKNLVFEPLLKWENGFVRPALFASWTHASSGRDWRFTIRDGARFHDGKPCIADDILAHIAGILEAVDTFGMKWSYARYLAEAEITAEGDRVVRVRNPRPIADILDIFSEFHICRLDSQGRPLLGTGRYRVASFAPDHADLERVAGSGPERIVAKAERSAEARLALLRSGRVDAALNLERIEHRLDFDPALDWGRAANTLSVMAYLNCREGLFVARDARRAVNLAIDRDRLVSEVFHGLAIRATTIVSPFHIGSSSAALPPIAYDPARARTLLAGLDTSAPIRLRTPTFMPERSPEIARFIAEALDAVGLKVDIEVETDRPEYARQIGRKNMGDMAIFDSSPHSTYRILNDKISSATKAVWWQGFDDAETERRIAAANAAVTDGEREAAYGRCLAHLHATPPWLYLVHPVVVFAANPAATGLTVDPKGTLTIS